ncbi:MAG: hypothetical protein WAQ98_18025 [Blastocatellia bacterium]
MFLNSLSKRWVTILFLVFLAGLYVTGKAQEMAATQEKIPQLLRIIPDQGTPGTELEIEGYRLGWPILKDVQVVFYQNGIQHTTYPIGGGWQARDLSNGLQQMKITVPDTISPGECVVVIKNNGLTSTSLSFHIDRTITPPTIVEASLNWASPGQVIWITGIGFAISDEIEVTDANGQTFFIETGSSSSGVKTAFTLPKEIIDGTALIRVIERRSGNRQASNPISLKISRGPIPLELLSNFLPSVASNQWLDLIAANLKPLEIADHAEALFQQNSQEIIVPIYGRTYPRVHVPATLQPGIVSIATRTWQKNNSSVWSEPITYTLAAQPSPPTVMSVEVVGWNEPIYLGPSAPETFAVKSEDSLILRGRFPVANAENLRLVLKNSISSFTLTPSSLDPGTIKVKLPNNLALGNWQLTLKSIESKASSRLNIYLQVQ